MQMRCGSRNCTALNAFFVSCAIQELDAERLRRVGNVLSIDFPLLLTKTKRKASDCERCCLPGALPEELYPIRLTSSQPLEKSDVEKKLWTAVAPPALYLSNHFLTVLRSLLPLCFKDFLRASASPW